jgi:PKD repeat protein
MVDRSNLVTGLGLLAGAGLALSFTGRGAADPGVPNAQISTSKNGSVVTANADGSSDPDGDIVRYEWNWGDGSGDATTTPQKTHAYAESGSFTITLTVTDDDGKTAQAQTTIQIDNRYPTAELSLSVDGRTVTADASGSSDPNDQITRYTFKWGDGTQDETQDATMSHTYDSVGSKQIELSVEDSFGLTADASGTIMVEGSPPDATVTRSVEENVVTATASGSTDPDGDIVEYRWDWGDGATETTTDPTAQHQYEPLGQNYSLSVTVVDQFGMTDTASTSVFIPEINPPSADLSVSVEGMSVMGDASGSSDPDGDIQSYRFEWGDGTVDEVQNPTVDHTYSESGAYVITVTVRDGYGNTDTDSKSVSVSGSPPDASVTRSVDQNQVTATASGSADPDGDIVEYQWDWGDGSTDTTMNPTAEHTYEPTGQNYTIEVVVVDSQGNTDSATTSAFIPNNDAPAGSVTISQKDDGVDVQVAATDPEGDQVEARLIATKNGTEVYDLGYEDVEYLSGFLLGYSALDDPVDGDVIEVTGVFRDSWGNIDSGSDSVTINFNSPPAPALSISWGADSVTSDGVVVDARGTTDPDGDEIEVRYRKYLNGNQINSYDWDNLNDQNFWFWGGPSGTSQGDTITVEMDARDSNGQVSTVSDSLSIGGTDFSHTLVVQANNRVANWTDLPFTLQTTGEVELVGGVEGEEYGQTDNGGFVSTNIGDYPAKITINYNGDLTQIEWRNTPIITEIDGERVDPYEIAPPSGPRFRWTDGEGSEMIEATIRVTEEQYNQDGFTPARASAKYISESLKINNVNHDILWLVAPPTVPTQDSTCFDPYNRDWEFVNCREDGCNDPSCCSVEDAMPGAVRWWAYLIYGTQLKDRFESDMNTSVDVEGDTYVQRKDSNMLLTRTGGAGCAFIDGRAGVAGVDRLSEVRDYDTSAQRNEWAFDMQTVMHEFGHNNGYSHPGDTCKDAGGVGVNGENVPTLGPGDWVETPCLPERSLWPCDNFCGNEVPQRDDGVRVYYWLQYTQCTTQIFRNHSGPETGRVEAEFEAELGRTEP